MIFFLHICANEGAKQLSGNRTACAADQHFCFRFIGSIPLCTMWNFTAVSPEITDDYWIFGDNWQSLLPVLIGYHLTLDYYGNPFLYNNFILFIKVRNYMLL